MKEQGILYAWQVVFAPIKVYDENHNEILYVISIDFTTGEILQAVVDEDGKLIKEGDEFKNVKTIYKKFSIEYNELNEPGN